MRRNWRDIVIVLCVLTILGSGGWMIRGISERSTAEDGYAALAQLAESNIGVEAGEAATEEPPTYEEWLEMRAAEKAAAIGTPSPEPTRFTDDNEEIQTPELAEEAVTDEQLAEAEARAADEGAAEESYAEIQGSAGDARSGLGDTALRLLYYRWLGEQGYPVPEDADELEKAMLMDFAALAGINKQVTGWLSCEDTVINYPVVQGEDNEYYLHHLFDGSSNASGTLFMDVLNTGNYTDQNTIIYGHHMNNDTMFGMLVSYKEQAYYDAHPEMILYTSGATYLVELFAGYTVQINGGDLPCFQMVFEDGDRFLEFAENAEQKSTFRANVEIGRDDKIVTLSTCTYEVYNARYVVHGKLTLIAGEEPELMETGEAEIQ